jgi:hypothetical protein
MASKRKNKINKSTANILILVKTDDGYYAAGPAWKLPGKLNKKLDAFKTRAKVPIVLSERALIITLDKATVTPEEWVAQNLIPRPLPHH